MVIRLLGLTDEQRLAIEEASEGTIKTEAAQLLIDYSTQSAVQQVEEIVNKSLNEVQGIIGPHGSVTRLQAGGINITPGGGVKVYTDGVQKTTIESDGDLFVGSNLSLPANTTLSVFVNDQVYNNESFGEGDLLIGDNSTAASNIKYDASTGQLQFRYGTTITAYMDTDGELKVLAAEIGGWVIDSTSIKDAARVVGMSSAVTGGDDIRFFAGNTTPSSAPFRVTESGDLTASDAHIAGEITATTGDIGGWKIIATAIRKLAAGIGIVLDSSVPKIQVGDTSGNHIVIDGANEVIKSSNFSSGASGFQIEADTGNAEFNNLTARGKIKTAVFEKDSISAIGGSLLILPGDVLDVDMTAADNSTLTISGDITLAVGDILRMKDATDDEWLEVTDITSAPTYIVTRDKASQYTANNNPAWKKGQALVSYGQSGDGGILIQSGTTPSIYLFNHTGTPWISTTNEVILSENGVSAGNGNVTLNANGLTITEGTGYSNSIKFNNNDRTLMSLTASLLGEDVTGSMLLDSVAPERAQISIQASNGINYLSQFMYIDEDGNRLWQVLADQVAFLAMNSFNVHYSNINIDTGKTYDINGSPHSHIPIVASDPVSPTDGQMWLLRQSSAVHANGEIMGALGMTYHGDAGIIADLQLSTWDAVKSKIIRF